MNYELIEQKMDRFFNKNSPNDVVNKFKKIGYTFNTKKAMNYEYPIKVKQWKDKQTGCWLMYSKKFDISSYGKTKKEAKGMFNIVLTEILLSSKPKK